jgi:hypothetical protein
MALLYKNGDIFISLWQRPNPAGYHMLQYDGTTHALIRGYTDTYGGGGVTNPSIDGAFLSPLGHLWVLHFSARAIECWDAHGTVLWVRATPNRPECVLFSRGHAWVGCVDSGELLEFQLDGTPVAAYAPQTDDRGIDWLVQHPDGTFLYTSEGRRILRWNPQTHAQMADFAVIADAAAYAAYTIRRLPASGQYVVVEDETGVHRFSSGGTYLGKYASLPSGQAYFSLDVESDGQHFWVSQAPGSTQLARKVNVASGAIVATIDTGVANLYTGVITTMKATSPLLKIS